MKGVMTEAQNRLTSMWQVDSIKLTRLRQTVTSSSDKFIVRICFPPLETGEEINHVSVTLEHRHCVIATAIHPAASSIGPNIRASPRTLTRRLVCTGHGDIPSRSTQRVGRIGPRSFRPQRVMIFISVLFIGLRNDSTRSFLPLTAVQHKGMLIPRPLLIRGESKPVSR